MPNKRILILSEKVGEGHERAAQAIRNSIYSLDHSAHVMMLNPWKTFYPALTRFSTETYLMTLKVKPELWSFLYDKEKAQASKKLIKVVGKSVYFQMERILNRFNPDFIVCTHPFTYYAINQFKKELVQKKIYIATCITDFDIHSYWIDDCIDFYFVASEQIKEKIVAYNVNPENIYVTGIPIDNKFNVNPGKNKCRQKLGLDIHKPTVLIMGGGLGLGNMESIASEMAKTEHDYQVVFISGNNDELKQKLLKIAETSKTSLHVTGFVDNIHEYMAASDMIITKTGGLTVSEALAMHLPIIVNTLLPGQEVYNLNFLINNGAAIKANDTVETLNVIDKLITDKTFYDKIKDNVKKISKPNSSLDVANIILKYINEKNGLLT